ncbi:hypothetical protein [Kutzneria sp. CA-103260]|uniref:hypothetical protein n=1 Tax=Kutzneria sp. CA-103260 TaxID=2802641 RepID=UPI001BAD244B|nr:hypothetical protein [Kutzneria sp. CA-103260]QUQ72169.1 Regulator of chromosome condensation (RCC1) repeat protein [Kutzneria sp. CA-103260]
MRIISVVACALLAGLALPPVTASAAPASGTGNGFTAVTPNRVLDTRVTGGPVQSDSTRVLDLSGSVPADATAVLLNVTATDVTANTFVTAWPDGGQRPITSNLNLVPGRDIPNAVTVELRAGHKIDLYNHSGSVDLVADLEGYYSPSASTGLAAQSPARVLDTRNGIGVVGDNATYTLDLSGSVPANATAVVLNLTGTNASTNTFVTAWPHGVARPNSSSLNLTPGVDTPNGVTVPLGAGGKIDLYNAHGSVDLIADLAGYYAPTAPATFSTISSSRALDTRSSVPVGPVATTVDLSGLIPPTATAVVLNLTGTDATTNTFVTVAPHGASRPNASTLNLVAGQTVSNSATVAVSPDAKIDLYNAHGTTDVIVDVFAYFAPPFTCAQGCVYGWGSGYLGTRRNTTSAAPTPTPVFGLDNIVATDSIAGFGGTFALRNDGTVWAWGPNPYGELGNNASCAATANYPGSDCYSDVPVHVLGLDHVTALSTDGYSGFALRDDGTVWEIGPSTAQVPGISGVTAIAGSGMTDYALKSDGTVWAWGSNSSGELGIGTTTADGTTTPVQVHNLTGVTAISAYTGGEALRGDGTVWVWGPNAKVYNTGDQLAGDSALPVQVAGLTGVTALSGQHALKSDGTVWSWGTNNSGDVGNGSHSTDLQPTPVQTTVTGTAALARHIPAVVLGDGTARIWGDNLFGRLGTGHTGGEADSPIPLAGLTGVTALSGNYEQAYALTAH